MLYKMKVLDRYIIREMLRSFFSCLGFFTALLLIVRFSEKEMGTFISRGMSVTQSLMSLAFQTPGYIVQMAPPSMLFAIFFSLGRMSQNNEITAMKSSGISLYRIFMPVFVISLLVTISMIAFNDQVVTWATGRDIDTKTSNTQKSGIAMNVIFMSSNNRVFYIKYISLAEHHMQNLTIYEFDDNNRLIGDEFAREVSWSEGIWHLRNGIARYLKKGGWEEKAFGAKDIAILEDPELIVKGSQGVQRMPASDLTKFIEHKKRTGQVVRKELVAFHSRFSFPFACFMMALLGAPLFVRFGKSGMAVGFLLTMFVTFVYWGIAIAIFEAYGNNGKLPPALSCWAANLIFASIGTMFVYKVKK